MQFTHPILQTVFLGKEALFVSSLSILWKCLQYMLTHVMAEFVGFSHVLALWGPPIPESLELFELEIIGAFTHVVQSADLSPVYDGDGFISSMKVENQCIYSRHICPRKDSKYL